MEKNCGALRRSFARTLTTVNNATKSKWFLGGAIVGIFVWTVIRGIPAWPLSAYGMNIWVFVLIDLITSVPYVICINQVVRGIRTLPARMLVLHGAIIACSFAAPYLYLFWTAGAAMPTWVLIVAVSVVAVLAIVGPLRKIVAAWKGVR